MMRQMNLKPIIQNEVSQKEKDKYHILTHIYRIQKNVTEEFICKAEIENKLMDTKAEGGQNELGDWD